MQKPLKYKANNWVDGMKLSSSQFVNTDLYFQDNIRDAISVHVNSFNFGLLPAFAGYRHSFDIQMQHTSTNYLDVNVKSCNAISADGCRIDIVSESNEVFLNQFLDLQTISVGSHFIVLRVNPFNRIPAGEPNPDETPIRYPFVNKDYVISMVAESDLSNRQMTDFFLPIGKFKFDGHNVALDEKYIMPSSTLYSHPDLIDAHNRLYTLLLDLQNSAFKVMEKTGMKEKVTNLGINIRGISDKILDNIASQFFCYRSILPNQSPIYLIEFFSNLSNVFFTSIKNVAGVDREEMLKYFYEWKDVTPSNFEERMSDVIEHKYNHLDIRESIDLIESFMKVITSLWNKLSTLEYIGQRRENIVVAEQKVVQEVQTRRTWSLLD